MEPINRRRLNELLVREREQYRRANARSLSIHESSRHLLAQVPMTWMSKWAGGFPVAFDQAHGALITDVDGHELVDFALGDTGAMAGHSPEPLARALEERVGRRGGVTTMLPNEDAEWVALELARRFGVSRWSFTLSATDANRWLLRLVRMVTGRPKVLVFSYSYHGTVDETFVVLDENGGAVPRPGNVGAAVDPSSTTRVVEFNDLAALESELRHGDVAAVLTEPALTNIGIVLPEPGFLEGVRRLCDETGTLLIVDETHTFSAGPGGATRRWGLRPDAVTIGKSLGGGVPCGAYGLSQELADRVLGSLDQGADIVDVGGVGGTLAGNALSLAAMRAVLGEVLTDQAFAEMEVLATSFAQGVRDSIEGHDLAWSVSQLGARCEYRFMAPAPRSGGESARSTDVELEDLLHLYCVNRGVLITPFHNMALMCPATTQAHVALHQRVFDAALDELVG
ncbi:MAG: aminotransferase class III-fold pyridoxal phosphate-dependent enzyme [Acidobacteriota bacterium]|nr:aminotransferase class III-fold pyridoxal phosphate-dependent enzyme [Acidobacteriota bacterium]